MPQTSAPAIRLLITPAAIKALDPCPTRWRAYRVGFPGPLSKPHALADLLTRGGVSDAVLHDDFLWVLHRLRERTPSGLADTLWTRLRASWLASPSLPEGSWLHYVWMGPSSCLPGVDTPRDWKERALAVIATMEQEETAKRGAYL